jgi:hypothetical protein
VNTRNFTQLQRKQNKTKLFLELLIRIDISFKGVTEALILCKLVKIIQVFNFVVFCELIFLHFGCVVIIH